MAYDLTIDGIVVKELPLNDNDKLLTIITGKKGKMTVLAKGIKAVNSKRSAGAHLFCYSEFCFVKRDDRLWLDAIEVKDTFSGLSNDIESVALASYFCEVLSEVCVEENEEQDMLRLILNCLYALANLTAKPKWMIKAAFELQTMCIQGFAPNFDSCALCGSELKSLPKHIIFELTQGGIVCDKCMSEETYEPTKDGHKISPETFEAIKYVCTVPQAKMLSFKLDPFAQKEFSAICEHYITVQLEKKFRTLDYYTKNFAK
ncbi:MAG: DNA repair protein RecO [Clostridia bacterium]|nr:DNA repair protein RecO [Clostridia bacterium]